MAVSGRFESHEPPSPGNASTPAGNCCMIEGGEGIPQPQKGLARRYTIWCNVCMDHLSDVLTAISHPTRRAIIRQLANGPARFLDVAKPFDTALNAVTKHLKLLERAGLIERRKQGREVFISFRGEPLREVAGWVNEYEGFWNERLDQFARYFEEKKEKKVKEK
jgi:DNA-binding transcriptional ArsR family regulator